MMTHKLSSFAEAALATVPVDWERTSCAVIVAGRRIKYPRFHATFRRLETLGLIEYRDPGTAGWEWRRRDPNRTSEEQREIEARNRHFALEVRRKLLAAQIESDEKTLAHRKAELAEIDGELGERARGEAA